MPGCRSEAKAGAASGAARDLRHAFLRASREARWRSLHLRWIMITDMVADTVLSWRREGEGARQGRGAPT